MCQVQELGFRAGQVMVSSEGRIELWCILGLYSDNGKENVNYYNHTGIMERKWKLLWNGQGNGNYFLVYWGNGKGNGNYDVVYWGNGKGTGSHCIASWGNPQQLLTCVLSGVDIILKWSVSTILRKPITRITKNPYSTPYIIPMTPIVLPI